MPLRPTMNSSYGQTMANYDMMWSAIGHALEYSLHLWIAWPIWWWRPSASLHMACLCSLLCPPLLCQLTSRNLMDKHQFHKQAISMLSIAAMLRICVIWSDRALFEHILLQTILNTVTSYVSCLSPWTCFGGYLQIYNILFTIKTSQMTYLSK